MKRPEKIEPFELTTKSQYYDKPDAEELLEDIHLLAVYHNNLVELVELLAEKAGIKFED